MKTKQAIMTIRTLWNSLLAVLLGTLLAAQAHGQIFVSNFYSGTVGEYDATTGATINASLISGLSSPYGIAVGGLYIVRSEECRVVVDENAATAAATNAA